MIFAKLGHSKGNVAPACFRDAICSFEWKMRLTDTFATVAVIASVLILASCAHNAPEAQKEPESERQEIRVEEYFDADVQDAGGGASEEVASREEDAARASDRKGDTPDDRAAETGNAAASLKVRLGIIEDFRPALSHGPKSAAYQRYIVLHDTEGSGSPSSVVDWWDSNGNLVAAHFVVGKDGSIVQCVPLDEIAHHAGYGDAGHNDLYALEEDGRDDMEGSSPIGSWAPDYAMNAWSIGIEMVHQGGEGDYPEEQLEAVDGLIAYIDAYYGFESDIIDHKAWRSGNSDTSEEFAGYLQNYQSRRAHE